MREPATVGRKEYGTRFEEPQRVGAVRAIAARDVEQ
jgi:hypothetical protein